LEAGGPLEAGGQLKVGGALKAGGPLEAGGHLEDLEVLILTVLQQLRFGLAPAQKSEH
jgi:hypothetical protein